MNKKLPLSVFITFLLLLSLSSVRVGVASSYVIDGDLVYIDDENAYIGVYRKYSYSGGIT